MKIAQSAVKQYSQYQQRTQLYKEETTTFQNGNRTSEISSREDVRTESYGVSYKVSTTGQMALDALNKAAEKPAEKSAPADEKTVVTPEDLKALMEGKNKSAKDLLREAAEQMAANAEKLKAKKLGGLGGHVTTKEDMMIMLLEKLLSYGKKGFRFRRFSLPNSGQSTASSEQPAQNVSQNTPQNAQVAVQPRIQSGFGMRMSATSSYLEQESFSFTTQGKIITEDGRSIDFSVDFQMSRTFYEQHSASLSLGILAQTCDPLVINFDGTVPTGLTGVKFSFDLDNDGTEDQISQLTKGSGFLAFDKDGNGKIDNGSELFGPQSGNGFTDLVAYDEDGNGWIDENDAIFDKLRIWTKDEEGNDQLFSLGEKGIGAICLLNSATPFTMTPDKNENAYGVMQSTGIFLRENGTAGLIHHIDMVL